MVVLRRVEKQNINEAKQVGTLYHVCTLDALVQYIIPNNELRASGKYWNKLLRTNQQVCFTRDPLFVVPTNTVSSGNILFQFVVDGDKLSERYKVTPFNYTTSPNQRYREKEEDVIGPIKNFKSYIKEVRFDIKDVDFTNNIITKVINDLEKVKTYLGSIRCYRSELPFLDPNWGINFGKVKDPKYKIKTLDDLITMLKSIGGSIEKWYDNIDTPDLFVSALPNLFMSNKHHVIDNILEEHPNWLKSIDLVKIIENGKYKDRLSYYQDNIIDDINLLLKHGYDINKNNGHTGTLLTMALANNSYKLASFLIKNGANPDPSLYRALRNEDPYLMQFLIDNGADVNSIPLENILFAEWIFNKNILSLLLENGYDVNTRSKDGQTLLLSVLSNWNSKRISYGIFDLLLKYGANVNVKDTHGNTPLSLASTLENIPLPLIDKLIEAGATITDDIVENCKNKEIKDYLSSHPIQKTFQFGNKHSKK